MSFHLNWFTGIIICGFNLGFLFKWLLVFFFCPFTSFRFEMEWNPKVKLGLPAANSYKVLCPSEGRAANPTPFNGKIHEYAREVPYSSYWGFSPPSPPTPTSPQPRYCYDLSKFDSCSPGVLTTEQKYSASCPYCPPLRKASLLFRLV